MNSYFSSGFQVNLHCLTFAFSVRPRVTVHNVNQNENEIAVMSALKTNYENPFFSKAGATGTEDPSRAHPSTCNGCTFDYAITNLLTL